jgi:hypothetical protein
VPAVQQIEDKTNDFNAYYHKAGDTVEHMDADYWQAMMRGLVATVVTWAEIAPIATPTVTAEPTPTPKPTATPPPPAPRLLLPMLFREA